MRSLRPLFGALALLAASLPASAFGAQAASPAGSGGPEILVETLVVPADGDRNPFPTVTTSTLFRHDRSYRLVISGNARVRAEVAVIGVGDLTWFETYSSAWPAPEVRGELTDGIAEPPAFEDDPNGNAAGAYLQIGNASGKSMMPIWGIEGEGPTVGGTAERNLRTKLALFTEGWCEHRALGGGAHEWTCPTGSGFTSADCPRGVLSVLASYGRLFSCAETAPLTFQWTLVHAAARESSGGFTVQIYDLGPADSSTCRTSSADVCEPGEDEDPLRSWRWSASASTTLTGQPPERIKKGTYRLTRVTLRANGTFQIVENGEGSWRLDDVQSSVVVTYISRRVRGKGSGTVRRQIRAGPTRDLVVEIDLFGESGAATAEGGALDWEAAVSKSGFRSCKKGSAVQLGVVDGGPGEPDAVRWRVCNSGVDFTSGVARENVNAVMVGEA